MTGENVFVIGLHDFFFPCCWEVYRPESANFVLNYNGILGNVISKGKHCTLTRARLNRAKLRERALLLGARTR